MNRNFASKTFTNQILSANKVKLCSTTSMELLGHVNNYEWGKIGKSSKVAQLAALNDAEFKIDELKPYSELWMGDHVSGPSRLKSSKEELSKFITQNPEVIGNQKSLPFLLKVLSIKKALSLQVHPNKSEAERLHKEFPNIYKDDNHKPELAIALTPFLALCGFRPYGEVVKVLEAYPEVKSLIGDVASKFIENQSIENFKNCFEAIMRRDSKDIIECVEALKKRFNGDKLDLYERTFLKIEKDFPGDVGCVSMFFLNLVELQPGEAINLEANLIHAYIEGDCIECMACSDNVVRAGLTPKFKDVDTLIKMLDYSPIALDVVKYQPKVLSEYSKAFIPKVKDFAVVEIKISNTENQEIVIENRKFGSILLILEGEGTLVDSKIDLKDGKVIFLPANLGSKIKISTKTPFTAYQAMFNDF